MDRRCVGLEFKGERPITDAEARHLHGLFARSRNLFAILSFALIIAIPLWPLGFAIGLRIHSDALEMASFIDTIVLMVLIPVWNDTRRRFGTAKAAFMSRAVEMYAGSIDTSIRVEPAKMDLRRAGLQGGEQNLTLDRLSPSAIVLAVNGKYPRRQFRVGASEIAGSVAARQGFFPDRLSMASAAFTSVDQRVLQNSEMIELQRHAEAFRPRINWGWAIVVLFFGGMALVRVLSPLPRDSDFLAALSVLAIVTTAIGVNLAQGLELSRLISRDLADGFVLRSNRHGDMEVLPNSRLIWSQQGEACLWRRLAARDIND